jgi:hypothetical protein
MKKAILVMSVITVAVIFTLISTVAAQQQPTFEPVDRTFIYDIQEDGINAPGPLLFSPESPVCFIPLISVAERRGILWLLIRGGRN